MPHQRVPVCLYAVAHSLVVAFQLLLLSRASLQLVRQASLLYDYVGAFRLPRWRQVHVYAPSAHVCASNAVAHRLGYDTSSAATQPRFVAVGLPSA
jgi:hypothetical protein